MIAHRKHPLRPQSLWLVYIGAVLATLLLAGCGNSMASTATGDPGGIATGGKADVVGQVDGAPVFVDAQGNPTSDVTQAARDADGNPISEIDKAKTSEPLAFELANMIGQNRIAINFVWTLVTGFLVMFMQAGFALVETGFTRAKSAAHTMMMNFMVYGLGMLGYFIAGFAIQFGGIGGLATLGGGAALASAGEVTATIAGKPFGLFGTNGFFLSGGTYDVADRGHVPVPDGVHGHGRDNPDGCYGRALEVFSVLRVRFLRLDPDVPGLWQLGLGRRMVGTAWCELRSGPRLR